MGELIPFVRSANSAGVPYIAINSTDQWYTIHSMVNGMKEGFNLHSWNIADMKLVSISKDSSFGIVPADQIIDKFANMSGQGDILCIWNASRILLPDNAHLTQAILNCRQVLSATGATICFIGHEIDVPPELTGSFLFHDEELPTTEKIQEILNKIVSDVNDADQELSKKNKTTPKPKIVVNADECRKSSILMRGIPRFNVETIGAMAINRQMNGFDNEILFSQTKANIEKHNGLRISITGPTFEDVKGHAGIKHWAEKLCTGPRKPELVVFIDEIDKVISRNSVDGDNTNASGDALKVLLSWWEEYMVRGTMMLGHPGTGKTLLAESLPGTFNIPLVYFDISATRSHLLGSSEANIRGAIKTINSLGGKNCLVLATCNRFASIPPELTRRMNRGGWMFEFPNQEEAESIWIHYFKKFNVKGEPLAIPELSGADIRNIVESSYELGVSVEDAYRMINVPISKSDPASVENLRNAAHGIFKSSSTGFTYEKPSKMDQKISRMINAQ